jgi:hypothetical protein
MHDMCMLGVCLVRDCAYSHMLLGVLTWFRWHDSARIICGGWITLIHWPVVLVAGHIMVARHLISPKRLEKM